MAERDLLGFEPSDFFDPKLYEERPVWGWLTVRDFAAILQKAEKITLDGFPEYCSMLTWYLRVTIPLNREKIILLGYNQDRPHETTMIHTQVLLDRSRLWLILKDLHNTASDEHRIPLRRYLSYFTIGLENGEWGDLDHRTSKTKMEWLKNEDK